MLVVVMGVSGVGKTTIGRELARRLGAGFLEGDDFHPASNVAKMRRGEPLEDADRWPWLDRLAGELGRADAEGRRLVLACSALKRAYRDRLRAGASDLRFVCLVGDPVEIGRRLRQRSGHFMPPGLLESQLLALEPPSGDENAIVVEVEAAPQAIVSEITHRLAASPSPSPGKLL